MTDENMVWEGAVAQVDLFGIDDQQGGAVKMMEGEEEGEEILIEPSIVVETFYGLNPLL